MQLGKRPLCNQAKLLLLTCCRSELALILLVLPCPQGMFLVTSLAVAHADAMLQLLKLAQALLSANQTKLVQALFIMLT